MSEVRDLTVESLEATMRVKRIGPRENYETWRDLVNGGPTMLRRQRRRRRKKRMQLRKLRGWR